MLIFDQLKKNDPPLRWLALVVFCCLGLLLVGLWWVQVVSGRYYEAKLETQSFRTIRVPAPRGRILDRNGAPLAENQPAYNLSLYLEELSPEFQKAYTNHLAAYRKAKRKLTLAQRRELARYTRYTVASNVVARVGAQLQQPLALDPVEFQKHYKENLALPLAILEKLDRSQVARVSEQSELPAGLDLDIQATRAYPNGMTAVHLLGYVQRDDSSASNEMAFFNHYLRDVRGKSGVESAFDSELRGVAGEKAVQVNYLGYRQSENVITPVEPGQSLVLTIDLAIQAAAETALRNAPIAERPVRGAIVVMDVRDGDILAMASSPAFDPAEFTGGITPERMEQLNDENLRPQINRCTRENYAPGSTFKTVVALAALENGLNTSEVYRVQPNPANPSSGMIYVGRRAIKDTAPPGDYDFKKAFIHSSNSYFINIGIRAGIKNIVRIAQMFHLGERTGLNTGQEVAGYFPKLEQVSLAWSDGNTANTCIGQDPVKVTPLQMTVMTAAVANGGKVLKPRLVDRLEPQNLAAGGVVQVFPRAQVRNELGVSKRSLDILRAAMLADVEDPDGTGAAARIAGFRVCGKTGTAQVTNERNEVTDHTTWFTSYAPYESPRYAVVVMVEGGSSGGGTCAPIAREVYLALRKREQQLERAKATTLAKHDALRSPLSREDLN